MISVALRKLLVTAGSAALFVGVSMASASAATPTLTAGELLNLSGVVFNVPPIAVGASEAVGATQYGPVASGTTISGTAYFDYTFDLSAPATVTTSASTAGDALSTLSYALYEGASLKSYTSSTPTTFTYAGLSSGDYTLIVTGAINPSGFLSLVSGSISVAAVPVPGALLLFGTGLAGLTVVALRRRGSTVA